MEKEIHTKAKKVENLLKKQNIRNKREKTVWMNW